MQHFQAASKAIAMNRLLISAPKPAILSASYDCLKLFFDYLTLEELCAIGLTCQYLHQMAGQYYQSNYPLREVQLDCMNGRIDESFFSYFTNFGKFAQQITLEGDQCVDKHEDNTAAVKNLFRYASNIKNDNLNCMKFYHICHFTKQHGECLKDKLKNVESVEFGFCSQDARNYDNILRLCPKLKSLSIVFSIHMCEWPNRQYPTVEDFKVHCFLKEVEEDKLRAFLQKNPQIKKVDVDIDPNKLMDMIDEEGMKFDELVIHWENFGHAVAHINKMHERGHFKRLEITKWDDKHGTPLTKIVDELKGINSLVALHIWCIDGTRFKRGMSLPNVKKLYVLKDITLKMVKALIQCFPNLEELHMSCTSVRTIEEIVRSLPNLNTIEVVNININAKFNAQTLNEAREMHQSPCQLTINLHPKAYLSARWASVDLTSRLVNIKRSTISSLD